VAIIGASEDPFTYSGAPVANLIEGGFSGQIYPVNVRRDRVQGLKAYSSVLDVPGPVDTAVVAVPTGAVLTVLEECLRKEIRSVTLVSSGFGEGAAGEAGAERADTLRALISTSGMRVLGPNTAGLVNLLDSYVPRAAHNHLPSERLRVGGVALITQSGALANTVFNRAQVHGVGVGLAVATGGQIDIDVWELCAHALDDSRVRVVMLIVETINAAGLEDVAQRARQLGKAVILFKLGKSDVGRTAVMTHSGSLAGDAVVQSAALKQLGVIEAGDLDELWQVAQLIDAWGPSDGSLGQLGVVALSGGEGALIADECARYGIELGSVSDGFAQLIDDNFEYATASNPFDPSGEVIGHPEKVKLALRAFVEQNEFSRVLIASPALRAEIAERQYADIAEIVAEPRPAICFSHWEAGELTETQGRLLRETGLPVFSSSSAALRAMAAYASAASAALPQAAAAEPAGGELALAPDANYYAVRSTLARLGVPFPTAALVHSAAEAHDAAADIGQPLVMKTNVVSSTHKFANRLIALDVPSAAVAASTYGELVRAGAAFAAEGVVLEARAEGQIEVMVGFHRDTDFGDVGVVGAGGTMVEFLEDSAVAVARYMGDDAWLALVLSTRIGAFLETRAPSANRELAALLPGLATWFGASRELTSLDLNPFVVDLASGAISCVDCRVA
jgi:acyl-CoA synthetase (NDP forming)